MLEQNEQARLEAEPGAGTGVAPAELEADLEAWAALVASKDVQISMLQGRVAALLAHSPRPNAHVTAGSGMASAAASAAACGASAVPAFRRGAVAAPTPGAIVEVR
jgi:hypothetical protein